MARQPASPVCPRGSDEAFLMLPKGQTLYLQWTYRSKVVGVPEVRVPLCLYYQGTCAYLASPYRPRTKVPALPHLTAPCLRTLP